MLRNRRQCDRINDYATHAIIYVILTFYFTFTALDLKTPAVYEGTPKSGKADTTMTVSDNDMVEIAAGTLSPQVAYLKGKLKIAGNIMLAQKLGPLLKSPAKI